MSGLCCFFFFSSRRRHTRCGRDWSSDVCSSDLRARNELANLVLAFAAKRAIKQFAVVFTAAVVGHRLSRILVCKAKMRSEERRVGKECRSRWSAEHEKKKHTSSFNDSAAR